MATFSLASPPIAVGAATPAVFEFPKSVAVNVYLYHCTSEVGIDAVPVEDGSRTITASRISSVRFEDGVDRPTSRIFDNGVWVCLGSTVYELEMVNGATSISLTSVETLVTTGATHYRYVVEG